MVSYSLKLAFKCFFLLCCLGGLCLETWAQPPHINQIIPPTGYPGDTIQIMGTGFAATLDSNQVWLGDISCELVDGHTSSLRIIVPVGANPSQLLVLNEASGLLGMSHRYFTPLSQCITPLAFGAFESDRVQNGYLAAGTLIQTDINGDDNPDLIGLSGDQTCIRSLINETENGPQYEGTLSSGTEFCLPEPIQVLQPIKLPGQDRLGMLAGTSSGFYLLATRQQGTWDTIFSFKDSLFQPVAYEAVDWNQDGRQEIIVLDEGENRLLVFVPDASIPTSYTLTDSISLGTSQASWIQTAQIDADTLPDLLLGRNEGDTLTWIKNASTTGTIQSSDFQIKGISILGTPTGRAAASNLDLDLAEEFIIPWSTTLSTHGYLVLNPNDQGGQINWQSQFISLDEPVKQVRLQDFDGDGQVDIWMLPNANKPREIIFAQNTSQNGTITFASDFQTSLRSAAISVVAADWNSDEAVDLAVLVNNRMDLLFNTGRPFMAIEGLPQDANAVCPNDNNSYFITVFPQDAMLFGAGIDPGVKTFSSSRLNPGEYSIHLSYENQVGCTRLITESVEVGTLPVLKIDVLDGQGIPDTTFCYGDPTVYQLVGSPAPQMGNLSESGFFSGEGVTNLFGGNGTFKIPTLPNPPAEPLEYEITYQYVNPNFCPGTLVQTVTVNPPPAVATQVDFNPFLNDQKLCITNQNVFQVSTRYSQNEPIVLDWLGLGIRDTSNLDGRAEFSFGWIDPDTLASLNSVRVPYRILNTQTGCADTNSATQIEIIGQNSPDQILIEPTTICQNTPEVITAQVLGTQILEWTWFPQGRDSSQGTSVSIIAQDTGRYQMRSRIETTGGCITELDTTILVRDVPEALFAVDDECIGAPITLDNLSSGDITYYRWTTNTGLSDNDPIPFFTFDSVRTYAIHLTVGNEICADSTTESLVVLPKISLTAPWDQYGAFFTQDGENWLAKGQASSWAWSIDTLGPITRANNDGFWQTGVNTPYNAGEDSWLLSPCIDIRVLDRPMVEFEKWTDMLTQAEGAVLEIRSQGQWRPLGSYTPRNPPSVNWYNSDELSVQPGEQTLTALGWTGVDEGWINVRHSLDPFKSDSLLQFRLAFASSVNNPSQEGMAFDNFRIRNRRQQVLVETFINDFDTNLASDNQAVANLLAAQSQDMDLIQYHTAGPQADSSYLANVADQGARALFYGVSDPQVGIIQGNQSMDVLDALDSATLVRLSLQDPIFDLSLQVPDFRQIPLTLHIGASAKQFIPQRELILLSGWTSERVDEKSEELFTRELGGFFATAGGEYYQQSWQKGDQISLEYVIPDQVAEQAFDSIRVFAFIQDVVTQEVLQSASASLAVLKATGIPDPNPLWQVWPNPASESLYLSLPKGRVNQGDIHLTDLFGRSVAAFAVTPDMSDYQLNVAALPTGMYFLAWREGTQLIHAQKVSIRHP